MHHHQQQQQQPDSAAARKMAHPPASMLLLPPRAGGGGGSLEEPPVASAAAAGGPAPCLPPGAAPLAPQSLNVAGPSGAAAAAAAAQQLKKKSGFQITSVTPAAQISASLSSNNSLAEDTESYDDLDESHTEDLSSSEILDVSLSRAADPLGAGGGGGGPERSSSEETLSNCHEADTPGALSPNQPRTLNGSAPHPNPPASPAARNAPGAAAAAEPPRPPWRAPAAPSPLPGNGPAAQAPPAASRFRVVKLDSSSEPFRKGRWTCTEFYDKDGPEGAAAAPNKALEALRQQQQPPAPDGGPERETTTSGSSASSTLSHYTESAGSGEGGAPGPQQPDFGPPPGLPQSLSQPQLHLEAGYPPHKPPAAAGLAGLPPPGTVVGGPQQPGLPSLLPPQQVPFAQPVAAPQPLSYGVAPASQIPLHLAPGHGKAANPNSLPGPDYGQHQQVLQPPVSSMQPGPALVGTGTPAPATPAPSLQPSGLAHLTVAPAQPLACVQPPMPAAGAQGALPQVVQQPLPTNQMPPSVLPPNAAPSQVMPPLPAGVMPPGTSGLPQPLVLAPQTTLLPPAQPQLQSGEPLGPGMAGQQVPAISPGPAVGAVPVSGHCAASMPPPLASLAPSKNVAPSSAVHSENLVQKLPQSSLASASINLPMPQNMPPLNSALFSAQSLAQSSASRGEETRRSTDPLLAGIAQPLGPESAPGVPSALSDGPGSMAASLFPLKGLPLTAQLMDGEDDGSSGASVVAIDNKIEQAMDLVKSHLMYAVREEVEVLKEQIKELIEKNNQLEQENTLLKTLASPEQLAQFQAQLQTSSSPASSQPPGTGQPPPPQPALPGSGPSA